MYSTNGDTWFFVGDLIIKLPSYIWGPLIYYMTTHKKNGWGEGVIILYIIFMVVATLFIHSSFMSFSKSPNSCGDKLATHWLYLMQIQLHEHGYGRPGAHMASGFTWVHKCFYFILYCGLISINTFNVRLYKMLKRNCDFIQ